MRLLIGLLTLWLHWAAFASMPLWRGVEIRHFAQSAQQPDRIYALANGIVFRSNDRGQTWEPLRLPQPAKYTELHVNPRNAQHVLVLDLRIDTDKKPRLQESLDGGLTWTQTAPLKFSEASGSTGGTFFPTRLIVPAGTQASAWWAYDGRWFRSTDDGRTWRRQPGGLPPSTAGQAGSLSYSLDENVLLRSRDAGLSWEKIHEFEIQPMRLQRGGRLSNLIAISEGELVLRNAQGNWLQSNDSGKSWAPASNGFQNLDQHGPTSTPTLPVPPSVGETWCGVQRSPAMADVLLARCIWDNGASPSSTCFYVSTDAGRSWTPPRSPATSSLSDCQTPELKDKRWASTALLLDAVDPQRMLAAWQAGGLYRSDDGGKTWLASETGLMFRDGTPIAWAAVAEPPLIQAVLFRDRDLLLRTLASGVDINSAGNRLGGVLEADLFARQTQTDRQEFIKPMMWSELRKAGAVSFASSLAEKRLLTQALDLNLDDIADDLIKSGYDWGAKATARMDAPEGELLELLRRRDRLGSTPDRVARWVNMYINAKRFPSADQTTLDLLNSGHPELAIKVLKATSRRAPFDRQSTTPRTPKRLIAEGLETAGKKNWAQRILATSS